MTRKAEEHKRASYLLLTEIFLFELTVIQTSSVLNYPTAYLILHKYRDVEC